MVRPFAKCETLYLVAISQMYAVTPPLTSSLAICSLLGCCISCPFLRTEHYCICFVYVLLSVVHHRCEAPRRGHRVPRN